MSNADQGCIVGGNREGKESVMSLCNDIVQSYSSTDYGHITGLLFKHSLTTILADVLSQIALPLLPHCSCSALWKTQTKSKLLSKSRPASNILFFR